MRFSLRMQVVVHGADHQQRRDRGEVLVRVAVGEHDELGAGVDGRVDLVAHRRDAVAQGGGPSSKR